MMNKMKNVWVLITIATLSLSSYGQNIDLIQSQFGKSVQDVTLAVFPDANNFYQDINGGGSVLGNVTRVIIGTDSLRLFSASDHNPDPAVIKYPDLEWTWLINDSVVSHLENPRLSDIMPSKSGIQWLEIRVYHKPTGVTFSRGKWCFLQYNAHIMRDDTGKIIDNGLISDQAVYIPAGETRPTNAFGVFVPWLSYEDDWTRWAQMDNDITGDGKFTSTDLTLILSMIKWQ